MIDVSPKEFICDIITKSAKMQLHPYIVFVSRKLAKALREEEEQSIVYGAKIEENSILLDNEAEVVYRVGSQEIARVTFAKGEDGLEIQNSLINPELLIGYLSEEADAFIFERVGEFLREELQDTLRYETAPVRASRRLNEIEKEICLAAVGKGNFSLVDTTFSKIKTIYDSGTVCLEISTGGENCYKCGSTNITFGKLPVKLYCKNCGTKLWYNVPGDGEEAKNFTEGIWYLDKQGQLLGVGDVNEFKKAKKIWIKVLKGKLY